eukprot:768452-Hanusia_phi.AAC.11
MFSSGKKKADACACKARASDAEGDGGGGDGGEDGEGRCGDETRRMETMLAHTRRYKMIKEDANSNSVAVICCTRRSA